MITTLTPSPSIDLDYSLNSLQLGGVNRARAFSFHAGGKGVNVSRVLTLMKVNNVAMVPMARHERLSGPLRLRPSARGGQRALDRAGLAGAPAAGAGADLGCALAGSGSIDGS